MSAKGRPERKNLAELIAIGAAAAKQNKDLAAELRVSERTISRRLKTPEVQRLIAEIKSEMLSQAIGKSANALTPSVGTLIELQSSKSEIVRLRASVAVIDVYVKLREHAEMNERLERLEAKHASNDKPIGERFEAFAPSRNGFH